MVETYITAVGDDAVDEFQLARLKSDGAVAFVQRFHVGIWQLGDLLVENQRLRKL